MRARTQAYNSLVGEKDHESAGGGQLAAEYEGTLHTETSCVCTSEIILGPQEAVRQLKIAPGEAPRHFECGHALHSDCYAVYICSARSGHVCPICALDRHSAERDSRNLESDADNDFEDYDGEESGEGEGELHSNSPRLTFTDVAVRDALSAVSDQPPSNAIPPEHGAEDEEELDPEEELALQQALQMSIRGL